MSANISSRFMEHRWGSRVDLDARVELITPDGHCDSARVRNASLSGAFIVTGRKSRLMARVAVCVPGQKDWLDGCVVRVVHDGFAVEWLDPSLQAVAGLLALRQEAGAELARRLGGANVMPWGVQDRSGAALP